MVLILNKYLVFILKGKQTYWHYKSICIKTCPKTNWLRHIIWSQLLISLIKIDKIKKCILVFHWFFTKTLNIKFLLSFSSKKRNLTWEFFLSARKNYVSYFLPSKKKFGLVTLCWKLFIFLIFIFREKAKSFSDSIFAIFKT